MSIIQRAVGAPTILSGPSSPKSLRVELPKEVAETYARIAAEFETADDLHSSAFSAVNEAARYAGSMKGEAARAVDDKAPNAAELKAKADAAAATLSRIQERHGEDGRKVQGLRAALETANKFLKRNKKELRAAKPVSGRADVWSRHAELKALMREVREAPPIVDESIAMAHRFVENSAKGPDAYFADKLQTVGGMDGAHYYVKHVAFNLPTRRVNNVASENPDRPSPEAADAFALFSWFDPDKMKAHMEAEVRELYERAGLVGMSVSDKAKRISEIEAEMLELERAYAAHCFDIGELWRLGEITDARAILGVEIAS